MKAKEYYQLWERLQSEGLPPREAMERIREGLKDEALEIMRVRRVFYNSAKHSVLQEQEDKWRALCRLNPYFKQFNFWRYINGELGYVFRGEVVF